MQPNTGSETPDEIRASGSSEKPQLAVNVVGISRAFLDAQEQTRYQRFRREQLLGNLFPIFSFTAVITTLIVYEFYKYSTTIFHVARAGPVISIGVIIMILGTILPCWLILLLSFKETRNSSLEYISSVWQSLLLNYICPYVGITHLFGINTIRDLIVVLEDVIILSFSAGMGLAFFAQSQNLSYQNLSADVTSIEARTLPQESLVAYLIGLICVQVVFKGSQWLVILSSWLIAVVSLVASIFFGGLYDSLPTLAVIPLQLAIMLEFDDQLLQTYRGRVTQETLLRSSMEKENEKNLAEERAREIRFLIANVAHDLKTPLQAIGMGSDEIKQVIVTSMTSNSSKGVYANIGTRGMILNRSNRVLKRKEADEILEVANHISSACAFMSMTINRAIDFTKASHDIKLVPAMETANLDRTLSWPASIVRSLQARIHLVVEPISSNICKFVITDKGWLTENLLCLFSNAVKYSQKGSAVARCYLVEDVNATTIIEAPQPPSRSGHRRSASSASLSLLMKVAGSKDSFRSLSVLPPATVDPVVDTPSEASMSSRNSEADEAAAPRWLCIEVEDTGVGISDELKAELFNPFRQAQRMTGGTGLGLYSMRKRVEALGGACGVRNRRDGTQGSCFWFTIPYRPDETAASTDSRSVSTANPTPRDTPLMSPWITPRHTPLVTPRMTPRLTPRTTPHSTRPSSPLRVNSFDSSAGIAPSQRTSFRARNPDIISRRGSHDPDGDIGRFDFNYDAQFDMESLTEAISFAAAQQRPEGRADSTSSSVDAERKDGDTYVSFAEATTGSPPNETLRKLPHSVSFERLPTELEPLRPVSAPVRPTKVLIVDDSLSILKMTSRSLERSGYSILTAETGADAVEKYREHRTEIDVILMDLQMPVMDGLEAARRVRTYEKRGGLRPSIAPLEAMLSPDVQPSSLLGDDEGSKNNKRVIIIGMSANSDTETRSEALKSGMDYFIAKPFDLRRFKEALSFVSAGVPDYASASASTLLNPGNSGNLST